MVTRNIMCLFAWLLAASVHGAVGQQGCTSNGKSYDNLDIFDHSNGCGRLQCQFGKVVTYYEACGKEIDGKCHRLNFMFDNKGATYQCRKVEVQGGFEYRNEIAIPRVKNCSANGKTYRTLEKFRIGNGCREHQCQNGELVPLDAECDTSVDGECHRVGETFEKGGTVYICNSAEVKGERVYKNDVLDPQPTGERSCPVSNKDKDNFELFTIPPTCHVRQCQNGRTKLLTGACAFKREELKCYQIGEQWTHGDRTYWCNFNETTNEAQAEIIAKGYMKCKRAEKWYNHKEIHTRLDGCTSVQCQDGETLPVQEGCLWNVDNKCHDLNSIWRHDDVVLKCVLTEDGLYRIFQVDENGNIIDRPLPVVEVPAFAEHCPALSADIIIVLDASGSIVSTTFQRILNFTATLLTAFHISPKNVKVALIVFSGIVEKAFDLGTYSDYDSLSKAIREARFLGDVTNTDKALNLIVDDNMFGAAAGGRDDAPNIVVVVTDGNSTDTKLTLEAADRVKDQNAEIITVGVGHISRDELYGMATGPDNVFEIPSYDELFSLITKLANRTCTEIIKPKPTTTPPATQAPPAPTEQPPKPATQAPPAPTQQPPKPECPQEPKPPGCPDATADIIFLLDSSSGVGTENFDLKLKLAVQVTSTFTVYIDKVQFGAVLISTDAERLFNLNTNSNQTSVNEALQAAPYREGDRNTGKALDLVLHEGLFDSNAGGRKNVSYVLVVIIDGPSKDLQNAVALASALRAQGVRILVVGIDNYNYDELVGLSGDPKNVFYAPSYRTFVYQISAFLLRLCEATVIEETKKPPTHCQSPETNPCQHICTDSTRGAECSCREGYVINQDDPNKCDIKPCTHHIRADIVFVVDSSDSIKDEHYIKALQFVSDLVKSFPIGQKDVLVAALVYSWGVEKLFDLNTFTDVDDITKAIMAAPHLKESTLTHKALNYVIENKMFDSENGGRDNVTKFVILMTDGKSGYKDLTVRFAGLLKAKNVHIITIGVGNLIDKKELTAVASTLSSAFYTASYDVLEYIESEVIDYTCRASV